MFYRKIENKIIEHLTSNSDKILLINGARQVGKSFIVRKVGTEHFSNYVEINMLQDKSGLRLFENIKSVEEFYLQLSIAANGRLGNKADTLVFLDEIQAYPNLLTLLKFLRTDNKFTYVASGSMLGIALKKTLSIPMGSIQVMQMYPMDFEEFLKANGVGGSVIDKLKECFEKQLSVPESIHLKVLQLFKYYMLSGGLPDAVKAFVENRNIPLMRRVQNEIHDYYAIDASQYDKENKLRIRAVYDAIPSFMENKKKRVVINSIENKGHETFLNYQDEFDYLISSGIALEVKAVAVPNFPLSEGMQKNLLKLYLNDVGILTATLYGESVSAVMNDECSINLGSVYESVVAQELKAHGVKLFYYDNRKKGEVDFLINDYPSLKVLPIEVKSGKDYSLHASLDRFISNGDYSVNKAYVLSNSGEIKVENNIIYYPIYMCMFISENSDKQNIELPDIVF